MPGPVFLVGMMGSGKTTVGRRLAALQGAAFCDLDQRIERITGRTIAELFAGGEPAYRAIERAALRSLVAEPGFGGSACVVATGGGVVIDPDNRALMRSVGTVVLLDVPIDEIVRRLAAPGATRPLLAGGEPRAVLAALLAARQDAYREGALVVDAAAAPDDVALRIVQRSSGAP